MESQIALLRSLESEGAAFTSANFSFTNEHGSGYAGKDTSEWLTWKTRVGNLLCEYFDDASAVQKVLEEGLRIRTEGFRFTEFEKQKSLLLKAVQMGVAGMENDSFGELRRASATSNSPGLSSRVFIVHGHDHALKNELEALLHELGLEPIVLHKQPDLGRTLIEKFEENSDVGYAFVLLTADDIGYPAIQESLEGSKREKAARARQNVVFEFGYFVGRLGRERVCCLYRKGVEVPSDINGLVYKEVEQSIEAQAFSIIRELKAVGYKVKI